MSYSDYLYDYDVIAPNQPLILQWIGSPSWSWRDYICCMVFFQVFGVAIGRCEIADDN